MGEETQLPGNNRQNKRYVPLSELDLNLMVTDSVWGKSEVSPELRERLERYRIAKDTEGHYLKDEEGHLVGDKQSLWGLMGFFTRDMRLGNLDYWNGEMQYCQHFVNLANDLLHEGMDEAFMVALSRVATQLELSQSKGGFLRKIWNTLRTQNLGSSDDEPPKKTLFGGNKKKQY